METEDILKGFADGSKEGNSAGGSNADCAEVLATICAQTAEMMGDGDEIENDATGSTCETKTVGEERKERGMGSRKSLTGCIVKDENVVKTSVGEEYPYDINWVSGRVQSGIVGGAPCFAFKVEGTWVPFPAPQKNTWRNITLTIVFDRLLRLNDGSTTEVKGRYALDMWRVLEAQGEFRLNDFLYDSFDCGKAWVIGGNDATGRTTCHESDARRDLRWGSGLCVIPIPCGRVRMMMRDAMGNVWSTHYVNGNFSFRHLNREMMAVRALMEATEGYLVANFENTNEVAIHSKRVTIQVRDMRLVAGLRNIKREEEERQTVRIMSMSVAQVEAALAEVMKYAKEGVHYNGDSELSLLQDRVPRYFIVAVDVRSTIMANDEGCVKARTLLQRFRESPHVRVDNDVEDSAYSLKGVVQWICSEGMYEEEDVDMTMRQTGGTYTPANLDKLLDTVARNGGMLVDGSKDELKSGAAEILVLSIMKDITQTPPEDFQDVSVIVANGMEYILLDQLVDFRKKNDDDRNVIHEALHEVTEFALQGQDLIEFAPARTKVNIIFGRSLSRELLSAGLERLGHASCDVERQREREEGWKTVTREELVCCDIFNAFTMEKEQCNRGFEEADLPSCCAEYTNSVEEEDEEEDEGASSSDVEVSGNDVSSDEEDEEHDVYYDLKAVGGPFMSLRTLNSHRARACSAVADERTHGQEMDVVDDAGASSIGAVNLVSDESDDVGAPENVDGEVGTFEEQQPQPVEFFDSSCKLAPLIFSARGGVGAATAQRRTRAVTGQAKTTEARTEEGVSHLWEERDARGNPKVAARET
ncbi:hypothetical protein CBR_g686 [Chara braunii]|uniref:Core Histone H2A/H2B/H3 domain-containing protein n=1 Tax=Chara braunii TaxID=69332 RepID=A0A388KC12_CHABU|nr:hypothetical protein CBR_g686 [Chara braunii]|eukprot:GBG67557.1 hypothetical protein CBR_g686 [Chara braunii]